MEIDYARYVEGLQAKKRWAQSGVAYWMGRDLMDLLSYGERRNFLVVIEKARVACGESKMEIKTIFVETNKMVSIGSGAQREREDWY